MPQPLPVKCHLNHETMVVHYRPDLAILIARVATTWTWVEEALGRLFVQVLGTHARTGLMMYQALSSTAAQKAVLRAAAADRLTPEMQQKLEAALKDFQSAARRRNAIVHGLWRLSDDHPDALVWCDVGDHLFDHGDFWAGYRAHAERGEEFEFARNFKGTKKRMLLYKKQDFLDVLEAIVDVGNRLQSLIRETDAALYSRKKQAGEE